MLPMRRLCCLMLILCMLIGGVGIVHAKTESFNIEAGKEFVCKINVASKDKVQLTFVTTGQASGNLSFSMVFPNSTLINLGTVGQYSTSFTSDAEGTYELHFDNSNSSETTLVALNYEVEHYILGMPQMIFVLVAIAVLLLVIVAGYIILGKYS